MGKCCLLCFNNREVKVVTAEHQIGRTPKGSKNCWSFHVKSTGMYMLNFAVTLRASVTTIHSNGQTSQKVSGKVASTTMAGRKCVSGKVFVSGKFRSLWSGAAALTGTRVCTCRRPTLHWWRYTGALVAPPLCAPRATNSNITKLLLIHTFVNTSAPIYTFLSTFYRWTLLTTQLQDYCW